MITKEQIDTLKKLLQSGADAEFFFSSIKSADWLPALLENGFFKSPPEPERGPDWVRYPSWPQSRYLARVAAQAPGLAVQVALSIPPTENVRINEDILEVALAVPPESTVKLLPRIAKWLGTARLGWRTDELAGVVVRAAKGGALRQALQLFRSLIGFSPDPEKEEKAEIRKTGGLFGGLEPVSRLESHDYQEFLSQVVPSLLRISPTETIAMLAGVLNDYLAEKTEKNAPLGYDGSLAWRPSIEEHDQNPDFRQVSHLVSAIREAGESAVTDGGLGLDQLLAITNSQRWHIFKRLELHWVRVFLPEANPSLVRKLLLTPDHFFSGQFDLEYGLLLKRAFDNLPPSDQAQILQWADDGPRPDDLAWMKKTFSGEPATEEMITARIAHWRLSRLFWIKEKLPPVWRDRYEQWLKLASEPEHPGFHVWSGGGEIGVKSPINGPDFRALPITACVDYLSTWKANVPNWNGPTKEGLANMLQMEAKADVAKYFRDADTFVGVDSIYMASLLRGLAEGIKGYTVLTWTPFWRLTDWILQQPDPETEIEDEFTGRARQGRRWQSCRLEIARFLDATFKGETTKLPLSERTFAWHALELLLDDPDPSPCDETRRSDSSMDPFTMSLNTVRGEAFHGAFSYIWWVRSQLPEIEEDSFTLDDVAEAKIALEARLDPKIEPSLTLRSVFGANIPRLVFWDEAWFVTHLPLIFPAKDHAALWNVAWDTYVRFTNPNAKALELMRDIYATAIAKMPGQIEKNHREDARVSLAHHLVANYWWGNLDFTKKDDLLVAFFERAPDEVRGRAMSFIGRSLMKSDEPIPTEVLDRLVRLWNWRFGVASAANGHGFREELGGFAWWFDSQKFDPEWAAKQMVAALELSRSAEHHFLWLKRFASVADQYPTEAAHALELTLRAVQNSGGQIWEDEEATSILKAAVASGNKAAIGHARRAQNILLGMGRSQFLHLVPLVGGNG